MASAPIILILFAILLPINAKAQAKYSNTPINAKAQAKYSNTPINAKAQAKYSNTIPIGSSLSPINGKNISWHSTSGVFALGFYPKGNGFFAVGIWLQVNQTDRIIVWTANRDDPPVSSNATLELTTTEGLLLRTEESRKIIITDFVSNQQAIGSAAMLDGGNFILLNSSDDVIWQSFDHPTDTILGGQDLTSGHQLVSSKSGLDHSSGSYLLWMQEEGNLASYPANISRVPEAAYWSTESGNVDNSGAELHLYSTGLLTLQNTETQRRYYWSVGSNSNPAGKLSKRIIYRATLDADGIFRLYSHYLISNTSMSIMREEWSSLPNHCLVKGFCGLNSFCQINNQPECVCYPGFAFTNSSTKFQGCYQNFSEDICKDHEDPSLRYKITSLKHIRWFDTPYTVIPMNKEESCRESCLGDCNCWAALYTNITNITACCKYNFPLSYGQRSISIAATALFKVVLDNIGVLEEPNNTHPIPMFPADGTELSKKNTISILSISLGCVACVCFVFAISSFIIYKHRYRRYKKLLENASFGLAEDFSLQSFSYNELEKATNGFNEEIGRGTFGAVYKGILSEGNRTIAVKRLEKVVEEGIREFRAEMTTIGRTHHKNLVQLLGFCIEGSKKLLVYEFMSNGSLADRLFKAVSPPTWRERVRFVFDVARGIFYLHEECGVHIIHCNLKPQNILLDDSGTAKISDFGLARLLIPNQAKTSTGVERTSLGYFAPEWQKNTLISVKADVYSFGIVLFEVICCRRNIEVDVSTPDEITLSNWVYKCFKAGELDKLVEDKEVHFHTLERMVKVGLWCVQDDPALRPLMKNVILMLEGTMDIPVPPYPELQLFP